ncbi:tudor domain-containing protein 6 [Podargus strigoides]
MSSQRCLPSCAAPLQQERPMDQPVPPPPAGLQMDSSARAAATGLPAGHVGGARPLRPLGAGVGPRACGEGGGGRMRGGAMRGGAGRVSPGTTGTLRVCAVGLRPEVPLVRLWGLLGERSADYIRLHREIQVAVGPRLAAAPGPGGPVGSGAQLGVGDLGLVEMVGLWYRCCVVSRQGQAYRVFLLDEGFMVAVSAYYLARGCKELFLLPPAVLGCIVANVIPSGGPTVAACGDVRVSTWTVEAMEFLSHLHGKEVTGLVQEVVTPQLMVLELPQLVAQMHHLGLARQVTPNEFCQVLRCCLASGHFRDQLNLQPSTYSSLTCAALQPSHVLFPYQHALPSLDYFYPQLQLGVTVPVLVTHVSDPHHIYCQLQSMSQEIHCLSDTMRHACDRGEQDLLPSVGSPYAARGIDGQWYRALLLELISGEQDQQMAVVVFVDYGRKETVTRASLRHLPVKCFRMPVVTYPCALQGVSDGGCGWSLSQTDELKALVLGKRVSACIKAFNSFEHLYYVSLYGENGIDLNHLFGVQAHCLVSSRTEALVQLEAEESTAVELELTPGVPPVTSRLKDLASAPVAGARLKLGVFHDVQVSHLQDPSEFWLLLHEHQQLLRQLRQSMWNFYSHATKLDGGGWHLQPGSLCCARGKEGVFYRAVITRVLDSGVEIHLMDRGSTETVDLCAVKELLPRFTDLPALALKCCLAGVSPVRGSWSESSVSAFSEIVLNKGLTVCFLSAQDDKYMVEIFDKFQSGERSVNKFLAQGGHAEYQRCEIAETLQESPDKSMSQASSIACAGEGDKIRVSEKSLREESDLKRSDRALNPLMALMVRESSLAAGEPALKYESKENLPLSWRHLEVGSTINVVVSHVENPSYFWCQLSRSCHDLEVLMAEIQKYCKNSSHPSTWPNSVCLAQYPEGKKWYRALILSEVPSAEKVEVLYVDCGKRALVSLRNLRSADKRLLRLEAQAFRCSLYSLIQPNGEDPFAWDEEAIQAFQEFVNTLAPHVELRCTVFALASVNKELFNIVDLMTPFQSACQFLMERGVARPLSPQKPLVSSVQLHSYYYSTHGIKIGSEEDVYITHVEDPWTFYCQLERCADVLTQLTDNISRVTETTTSSETLEESGSLCLAKYTDNHWYRGVIMKTNPNTEVFFVDFGNTEITEKEHLLPLPSDACDILFLPMQAIKCSLSGVSNVPKEAATWFKQAVLERQLKAVIVARESDGQVLIELFDGNTQINAKLKELSLINNTGLCGHVENETLCSRNTDVKERNGTAKSPLNGGRALEREKCRSEAQGEGGSSERPFQEEDVNLFQPAVKGDLADGLLESDEMLCSKKDAFLLSKVEAESLLPVQMDTQSDIKSDGEGMSIMLKNVSDLLQQKIVPALKVLVYVSHVNDPLDFYVQLESDEAQLNSISESLNNGTQAKNPCGELFQVGDLISAVYSEDSLWYRAVVKEKTCDNLISVEYIDYGNTSVISADQARRLPEDLSSIPAISIHCFLGGLKCKKNTDWAEKAVLDFIKRTSEVLLTCEFVEKVAGKWEVILTDHQGIITVDLADENLASRERSCSTEVLDRQENDDMMIAVCEPLPPQAQPKKSLNTVEANVSVGAVEDVSGKADDGYETAEHQSSFDKELPLSEGESEISVLLEPARSFSPHVLGSERKDAEQELSEVPFQEDAKLKAELTGGASAASLFPGNKQGELQRLPELQVESSLSDGTGTLVELDQLRMHSSYAELKELILELDALSVPSSFGEETEEALGTASLDMQTASGSEAREKVLEGELFELPVVSEEMGEWDALKLLEILPSLNERGNAVPSVSDGEKTVELIPSDAQLALGEKAKEPKLNLSGIPTAEGRDGMEAEPPPLSLSSADGRPEKQLDLKTDDVLSMLGAKIEQFLEPVLLEVQPSQDDWEEDSSGLEHAALQSSANSGSQFSFLTEDLTNQRPVCTVKSYECKVKQCKEWQKKKDDCYVEEWLQQDLDSTFKECGNACVQSSACEPEDEEAEKRQNENLADCTAEPNEYTCNLKGFAVGSKCVVWTSLEWCEALILEVSEEGTRVLNLSTGSEEMVHPENVWTGVPDWAGRSSEAITPSTENLQSLPGKSLNQEEQRGCSSDVVEDPQLTSSDIPESM